MKLLSRFLSTLLRLAISGSLGAVLSLEGFSKNEINLSKTIIEEYILDDIALMVNKDVL